MSVRREPESRPPSDGEISKPTADISGGSRLVLETFSKDVSDIKADIKEINKNRHDDNMKSLRLYGTGFLSLLLIFGYGWLLLDGKISSLKETSIRIDTKLEELLKRVPPSPLVPPRP